MGAKSAVSVRLLSSWLMPELEVFEAARYKDQEQAGTHKQKLEPVMKNREFLLPLW